MTIPKNKHFPTKIITIVATLSLGVIGAQWSFYHHAAQATQPELKSVIVEFKDADIVTAKTPAAVDAQQAAIAEATNEVENIEGGHKEKVRDFDNLPYATYVVDAAGERALKDSSLVASVSENKLYRPQMDVVMNTLGGSATAGFELGDVTYNGGGTAIAVLDSGVDKTHPMLGGKVTSEACFGESIVDPALQIETFCPGGATESTDPDAAVPCDAAVSGCDHGTHVASIAAGATQTTGDKTVSGVASGADIVAVQIFSKITGGAIGEEFCADQGGVPCIATTDSSYLGAIDRIKTLSLENTLGKPIAAVNMSFGGGAYGSQAACDAEMSTQAKSALSDLRTNHRIAPVAAAGNAGLSGYIGEPACIASVVAVAATNKAGTQVAAYSNNNALTDLLAPGGDGTVDGGVLAAVPDGGYGTMNGTSMASPAVAGAFAVLREKEPNATVDQLLDVLQRTGTNVVDARASGGVTKKRIQVSAALPATQDLKPGVPSSLTGSGNTTKKTYVLSWGAATGDVGSYRVYINGVLAKTLPATARSQTVTGIKPGKAYSFVVRAVNSYGRVSDAVTVKFTADIRYHTKSMAVSAKHTSYHSTKLAWKKVDAANYYKIYRSTKKTSGFKYVKTTKSLSYTNTKLKTGTRYYYKVVPYQSKLKGLTSKTVSAKPSLSKAKITKAKATQGKVALSWKKISGASGYKVYRATSKHGTYKWLKTTKSRSYTNKNLGSKKTYYYKVKAYRIVSKKQISGARSEPVRVVTPR